MWTKLILVCALVIQIKSQSSIKATGDESYNILNSDGSFEFGYRNPDKGGSYHFSEGNSRNVVRGRFGSRNPGTGLIDETIYTAGPRGFRPVGPNIHRKYDLNQSGPRPIGSRDDPYFDITEDPSYNFGFRTRTYTRQESANRNGDVRGQYSYLDDIGERHNVEFIAGKNIGFHVKTPYPDSNPRSYGPLYYAGRGKDSRGHTSIQRGLDGSYKFVAAGPDQRRTEVSDSIGNVRGSYTYLDDRGKQHAVHYVAGPNIGYRVLKNPRDYHILFPFTKTQTTVTGNIDLEEIPTGSDFKDDDENLKTAATKHPRPSPPQPSLSGFDQKDDGENDDTFNGSDSVHDDLFGSGPDSDSSVGFGLETRPSSSPSVRPSPSSGRPKPPSSRPDLPSSRPNNKPSFGTHSESKPTDDYEEQDDLDIFDDDKGGFGDGDTFEPKPVATKKPAANIPSADKIIPSKLPSSSSDVLVDGIEPTGVADYDSFPPSDSIKPPRPPIGTDFSDEKPTNHFNGANFPTGHDSGPSINLSGDVSTTDGDINESGGTILRNVGSTNVNLPPGVAVRAHVQSIDILPFGSRLPSPSDQLERDTKNKNS